ncbi:MAG: hypothetical protein COB41_05540 [Proteobacteria bacterium]|nr:MAG: hypothetical protein COB41_05540 [Pseudomonadota bacterium]
MPINNFRAESNNAISDLNFIRIHLNFSDTEELTCSAILNDFWFIGNGSNSAPRLLRYEFNKIIEEIPAPFNPLSLLGVNDRLVLGCANPGASNRGLYTSDSNGDVWTERIPQVSPRSLATNFNGVIVAAVNDNFFYRSTNNGDTWGQVFFPTNDELTIAELQAIRFYVDQNTFVFLTDNEAGPVIFVSEDGASNWIRVDSFGPVDPGELKSQAVFLGRLYVGSSTSLFSMALDGSGVIDHTPRLWYNLPSSNTQINSLFVFNELLYVFIEAQAIMYSDDGINFKPCGIPISDESSSNPWGVLFDFSGDLYSAYGTNIYQTLPK